MTKRHWFWTSTAALSLAIATLVTIYACGSSSKTTAPPPGGGGLELNSGNIAAAGVFAHTFMTAGTFPYHCTIHSFMTGNSVTVDASSANTNVAVSITGSGSGYSPNAVTIKPGGIVTWTNNGGTTHTVTSGN